MGITTNARTHVAFIRINIDGVDNIKVIQPFKPQLYLVKTMFNSHNYYELTAVRNSLSGLDLCLNFNMFFSSDCDFKLSEF